MSKHLDAFSQISICHISTVHPRYDTRVFQKECRSLSKVGPRTSLIIADGKGDENVEGVQIYDIGKPQSRIERILKYNKLAFEKAKSVDADIYHFHDPELIPTALKLKKIGKKVVYDAHEDVPRQLLSKPYLNKWIRPIISNIFEIYENKAAKKFDGIVTATSYIRDRFIKINSNTIDVNNYPIVERFAEESIWEVKSKAVCYIGAISKVRGIEEMVRSADDYNEGIEFYLAGGFNNENLKDRVMAYDSWSRVDYKGFVGRDEVRRILQKSMVGLVVLHPIINYVDALPVKMFEYMVAGIPVISTNVPLWEKIISDAGCGMCVNPFNPKEIAKAVNFLCNNPEEAKIMGRNGRRAVLEKYNWEIEEAKLLHFYEQLIYSHSQGLKQSAIKI